MLNARHAAGSTVPVFGWCPVWSVNLSLTLVSSLAFLHPAAAQVCGCLPCDLDADGDVDQSDFGQVQAAMSGPTLALPSCGLGDLPPQDTVVLDAVGDVWIRECCGGATRIWESDLISVWSSYSSDGARRFGLVQFNVAPLAGRTLQNARLSLWSVDSYSGTTRPVKQRGYVIDSGGTPLTALTWHTYMAEKDAGKQALETLGNYDVDAPLNDPVHLLGVYVDGPEASPADLAFIEAAANGNGLLSIVFIADEDGTDYRGDWGDGTNAGGPGLVEEPARLIVGIAPPCSVANADPLPSGRAGIPYSASLSASSACSASLQWAVTECALPEGLILDADTGRITGTPRFAGEYRFRIRLADAGAASSHSADLAIRIEASPADFDQDGDVDKRDVIFFESCLSGPQVAPEVDGVPDVLITEFMASNDAALADQDGDASDWIEIGNLCLPRVNLDGWFLTDDPSQLVKWRLPGVSLDRNQYLVIFASGKDRAFAGSELHANFKLDADGEYLALVRPDGLTVAHEYAPQYPKQHADVSYGTVAGQTGYFAQPTPEGSNGASFIGFVADTKFAPDRGFYDAPVHVTLTTATEGAEIRYTTDGSAPTATSGTIYTGPVLIPPATAPVGSKTTVLRAAAFKPGYQPTNVDTHTYLFTDDVVRQSASPAGMPATWISASPDYQMDPNVVNDTRYRDQVVASLKAIPTLSVAMNVDDLFGARGIYSNPTQEGAAWERPASIELIEPDGAEGFQEDCGMRIFGYGGRSPTWKKHSFRAVFKKLYGSSKLDCPLFTDSSIDQFDTLVFRATTDTSWIDVSGNVRPHAQYIRDLWTKDTERDMGNLSPRNTYVHLYLDGVYWGLYTVAERPDASFMAEYLGGHKEDYDAISKGTVVDGSLAAWQELMAIANAGVAEDAAFRALSDRLDVEQLINYLLVNFYAGNRDWPGALANRNWRAAGPRAPGQGGFRLFSWDAEICFGSGWSNTSITNDVDIVSGMIDVDQTPARLYWKLRENPEWRMRFADLAHRHLFNDGALTPARVEARWMTRADQIDLAIIAESARWGDSRQEPPLTRDDWLTEQSRLRGQWFPQRTGILLDQLRSNGLYPDVPAPLFNQRGGEVSPGFLLTLDAPGSGAGPLPALSGSPDRARSYALDGADQRNESEPQASFTAIGPPPPGTTLYFSLDGTDPRTPGGSVAGGARVYTGPVTLIPPAHVKARALNDGQWSALSEAVFTMPQAAPRPSHHSLRRTELERARSSLAVMGE